MRRRHEWVRFEGRGVWFCCSGRACPVQVWVSPMLSHGLFWSKSCGLVKIVLQLGGHPVLCLHHFTLPPAMEESSTCSTSLSRLVLSVFIIFRHSGRYVVISYCGFNLHLPDEQSYWALFFVGLLAICVSSSAKCLLKSFAYLYWVGCLIITDL